MYRGAWRTPSWATDPIGGRKTAKSGYHRYLTERSGMGEGDGCEVPSLRRGDRGSEV